MKHKLLILTIIAVLTSCSGNTIGERAQSSSFATSASAASPAQMRFHCADDTTEINTLLARGAESGLKTGNELMAFYGRQLLGTPYVAHTLEGTPEQLTINIHQLDCTTFVETLYALTRATLERRLTWRDYAHNLENVRYRQGVMTDYSSRLHYMSDWLVDNIARSNVVDLTPDFSAVRYQVKTLDFMTTHRDLYPALADDAIYRKMQSLELGYHNHRFPYLPKGHLAKKGTCDKLREGDIVGLVTSKPGLDISHLGIIVKNEKGEVVLLDASMSGGKVQIEPTTLHRQLSSSKTCPGVRLWRLK